MTEQHTGATATPEPGAIVFLEDYDPTTGFTYDEALAWLSKKGGQKFDDESLAFLTAAAADAEHTGAMIALVPVMDDVVELQRAIDPKVAEPLEQLHCTVLFLGLAADLDEEEQQAILDMMEELAMVQPVVLGNIFGFNVWNPDGPEPCVVAAISGADLEDACMSICGVMDEAAIDYPDQHMPWVPHITLAYTPDPVAVLTDEVLGMTGPIAFDRIRVAFAGVNHDFPLMGEALAAAATEVTFHLAGQHNQDTHGRGGASPGEIHAADRLSKGKRLDESDPEQAAIAGGVSSWVNGGQESAQFRSEIQDVRTNPGADTVGAKFTRTVAAAPAGSPTLHRGMAEVPEHKIPRQDDVFELGPTSFTRSTKVRDDFSAPLDDSSFGVKTRVHMEVAKGSRSIQTSHYATNKQYAKEEEHVALGKFHVTSRTESIDTVTARNGKKVSVKTVHLKVVQLDEHNDMPSTFRPTETRILNVNDLYG